MVSTIQESKLIDFKNCRLCQVHIGTVAIDTDLTTKIFACTQIKLTLEEDLKLICKKCRKTIEQFYAYLKRIKDVNRELIEIIERKRKTLKECNADYQIIEDKPDLLTNNSVLLHRLHDRPENTVQDELCFNDKSTNDLFHCKWENCRKVCRSAYTLKTHEMRHEGKRPYLCITCGKGFVTKNSLNCHEKIHAEIKAYTCKLCNIGFSVRSNLRAHEKKHHEGVRFYCSQCTRAFITKCSLERHERLHVGIRDYQCQSCPSAFFTKKELLKHQRYHQGLKQHKCDQCYKSFYEKHHLTIHIRSHTGERPYVCKIPGCVKSFAESHKLTRHLKARHNPCPG